MDRMIYISCGVKQDFIIELLENSDVEGIKYKYEGKKGIKLSFSVNTEDLDQAINIAKQAIKETEVGSVLYFQIAK